MSALDRTYAMVWDHIDSCVPCQEAFDNAYAQYEVIGNTLDVVLNTHYVSRETESSAPVVFANWGTVLVNVMNDMDAWATIPTEGIPSFAKGPNGEAYGYRDGTPLRIVDTAYFEGANVWGHVMWIDVEYNRYGNRATYGINAMGGVSCYMN